MRVVLLSFGLVVVPVTVGLTLVWALALEGVPASVAGTTVATVGSLAGVAFELWYAPPEDGAGGPLARSVDHESFRRVDDDPTARRYETTVDGRAATVRWTSPDQSPPGSSGRTTVVETDLATERPVRVDLWTASDAPDWVSEGTRARLDDLLVYDQSRDRVIVDGESGVVRCHLGGLIADPEMLRTAATAVTAVATDLETFDPSGRRPRPTGAFDHDTESGE